MSVETPFYEAPRGAYASRDRWYLVEDDDGSMYVLHKWDRPEAAEGLKAAGEARTSIQDFLRSDASDTAKQHLWRLLEGNAHVGLPLKSAPP